ncbi:MAG TPA: 30S ribosomal protein S20 [Clostridiales bacterium]|nr:30S ribosomal protein S20 [Clostridiales bacterium]
MPNIKSAIKRVKSDAKKNLRNRMVKSQVKTAVKRFTTALASEQGAQQELVNATSVMDKAVAKGIVHKNTANRKKARMAKALHKASTQA